MENQSQKKIKPEQICLILKVGSSIKRWNKLSKQSKDRKYRLGQLVTTELQYLNDLKLIHQKIQKPLRQTSTISEQQEKQMFPNIQGMIHFSSQIYTDMSNIQANWNRRETLIAPNMIKYSQFMLVYSDFFKNYQTTEKKLKLLVDNSQVAQKIEKQLVQKPRVQTFNNLMSKPFQRPLKYLLLLKQYLRETPKSHPDYKNLKQAVQCYHKVNQRNNQSLQHKQKDKMLITLDNIFKDIISSDARYFISQSEATLFDVKVKCYILSDLVLITKMEGQNQIQFARIQINQSSFVTAIKDSIYMKNRLLICGKKICIHITFQESSERDRFSAYVNGIITDFYNIKHFKEEIRGSRRSTMSSLSFRQSQELSQSDLRISMTQLECSLPQPPRIVVLGPIKRIYSSRLTKIYYLTKYQLPFRAGYNDYNQILYIDQQDMAMIQRISKNVYSKQKDFIESPCLDQLIKLMQSNNQIRNQQYKSLYYTLLLNSIYRHPNIAKRTDIFAHKMDVTLGLWLQLKYPGFTCSCNNCSEGQIVTTINKYNAQLKERFINRQKPRTFYCPFRTFQVQNTILSMTTDEVKQIQQWNDRIFWINCSRGCLEYRLLDNSPIDMGEPKLVIIQFCYGIEKKKYERHVRRQDRVGQIKCSLSRQLGIDLIEYQMCMEINKITYFLGDDQVLHKLLANQLPPEEGFSGFFKNAFGTKQDTSIKILLKRIWWPINRLNQIDYIQKVEMRMNLFVNQLAYRFKNQQVILNVKDTITFYACYLFYIQIKEENHINEYFLQLIVPTKKWKLLNSKNREEMLGIVRNKFKALQTSNFINLSGLQLKKSVFQFIVKYLKTKPIWGIYNFEGQYMYEGKNIPVRIGFDLTNFIVKQPEKVTCIFQDNIKSARQKILVSNWQMRIRQEERQYIIIGPSFIQMLEMLDMYIQYSETFVSGTS